MIKHRITWLRPSTRWRAGLAATAAVAALVWPAFSPGSAQAAPAAVCGGGGTVHYYATSHSGAGTNKGTGGDQLTWTHWSLDGHPNSDAPFSDEAVWTLDSNNGNNALEVGFATGYEGQSGLVSNGMYPYYTIKNDADPPADERDFPGTALPTDTVIWDSATSDGTHSWAYVNNKLLAEISYGVATPRENYEQTETNYHDIWMGGGSQSSMYLYYQTPSNAWDEWGFADSSAFSANLSTGATGTIPSGWYGIDTTQPDYTLQGGYGKAC